MNNYNFNFSIPELAQRADKLALSFQRDTVEFGKYGYSAESIEDFIAKNESLKQFLSDDFYAGQQKLATDTKKQIRENLEINLSDLRNRVKLVYGQKSVDYGLFKFNKLGHLNDLELVHYAYHVVSIAEPRLDKLSEKMVTQEALDILRNGRKELDDAIDAQGTAVFERSEKSIERTKLANQIYQKVSELSEVGKMIWKGKNEAFYNDYVIYGSSKPIVEQVEELAVEDN